MKRKTAKELLTDSFRELAVTKDIDKITVQNIVENCGYSTATFYRHFKDKYDLIAWDYTRDIEKILEQDENGSVSWKQAFADAAQYYGQHKEYLANLLLHTSGYNSFIRYMAEINYNSLKERICFISGTDNLGEITEMYIRIYCLGTVNLTCEWILGKYSVSSKELQEVYEGSIPDPLQQYLC